MPLIQTDSQHYSDIADAIRDMSGNEETFYPSEMAAGVRSIPQTIAIQPIIYSLEEREVGVWTDGKPLYVRTWAFINSTSTFNDFVTIPNGTISDCDKVVNLQTVAKRTIDDDVFYLVGGSVISLEKYSISNYRVLARTKNGEVQYYIEQYGTQITDMAITVYYTKTTDTPGSGTWTPSGVPAHHYSTEEQVIGTWIDGKPLYEKTFNISSIGYTTIGVFITLASVPSNIQFITKIEGILYNSSNTMCYPLEHEAYDEKLCIIRYNRSENSLDFCSKDTWSNGRIIVTIRYTKTTD